MKEKGGFLFFWPLFFYSTALAHTQSHDTPLPRPLWACSGWEGVAREGLLFWGQLSFFRFLHFPTLIFFFSLLSPPRALHAHPNTMATPAPAVTHTDTPPPPPPKLAALRLDRDSAARRGGQADDHHHDDSARHSSLESLTAPSGLRVSGGEREGWFWGAKSNAPISSMYCLALSDTPPPAATLATNTPPSIHTHTQDGSLSDDTLLDAVAGAETRARRARRAVATPTPPSPPPAHGPHPAVTAYEREFGGVAVALAAALERGASDEELR